MKLSFMLYLLGGFSLATADLLQDAGARDPKFAYPLPKLSTKGIDLVQGTLFQEYLELDLLTQLIKTYPSAGHEKYPKKTAKTLKDIRNVIKFQIAITVELLKNSGAKPVQACKYQYPPQFAKFSDFVTAARLLITARIDYTLYLAGALLQSDPEIAITPGASNPVLGRWDAFFRILNGVEAFEGAFQTPISPQFAYHITSFFVVPGSCPSIPPNVSPLPRIANAAFGTSEPADYVTPLVINWVWNASEIPQAVPGAKIFVAFHNQVAKPEYVPLNITSPGRGTSGRPTDIFGQTYTVFTNNTDAVDVDSLTAKALSGPWVFAGPFN